MPHRRTLLAGLLAAALVPSPGLAATPDFSGTWRLDRQSSEKLGPILEIQGLAGWKRKLLDSLDVTQIIAQEGTTLTVNVVTRYKKALQTWQADGVARPETRDGKEVSVAHAFDGTSLVTTATGSTGKGESYTLTSRRTVSEDRASTTLALTIETPSQRASVTRKFSRAE